MIGVPAGAAGLPDGVLLIGAGALVVLAGLFAMTDAALGEIGRAHV